MTDATPKTDLRRYLQSGREIDGAAGLREDNDNLAPGDHEWWLDYRMR